MGGREPRWPGIATRVGPGLWEPHPHPARRDGSRSLQPLVCLGKMRSQGQIPARELGPTPEAANGCFLILVFLSFFLFVLCVEVRYSYAAAALRGEEEK